MAAASVFVMNLSKSVFEAQTDLMQNHLNVGSGDEVTIGELAETIASVLEFKGAIEFDASKLDGTPRKLMDTTKLTSYGWKPKISLEEGIERTYQQAIPMLDKLIGSKPVLAAT